MAPRWTPAHRPAQPVGPHAICTVLGAAPPALDLRPAAAQPIPALSDEFESASTLSQWRRVDGDFVLTTRVRVGLQLMAAPSSFDPATMVRLDVPGAGPVTVRVVNAAGRSVRTLANGRLAAGRVAVPRTAEPHLTSGIPCAVAGAGAECRAGIPPPFGSCPGLPPKSRGV